MKYRTVVCSKKVKKGIVVEKPEMVFVMFVLNNFTHLPWLNFLQPNVFKYEDL